MGNKEEEILNSALKLFVNNGFHGASTSSIAEHASVSNGTLFHYYKSKESLIQALHGSVKSEQIAAISKGVKEESDVKEQFRLIWRQSIEWALTNEEKHSFLLQYKYSPYRKKHKSDVSSFKNEFYEMTEKGIQLKLISYLPNDFVFDLTNGNVCGMVEYLKGNPVKFRTPEFMRQAFENFWKSLNP